MIGTGCVVYCWYAVVCHALHSTSCVVHHTYQVFSVSPGVCCCVGGGGDGGGGGGGCCCVGFNDAVPARCCPSSLVS